MWVVTAETESKPALPAHRPTLLAVAVERNHSHQVEQMSRLLA
jgi:hypothetical protein